MTILFQFLLSISSIKAPFRRTFELLLYAHLLFLFFLNMRVIPREPSSYISERHPVPGDCTPPWSACSSEGPGTRAGHRVPPQQHGSPSRISSLAKSSVFVSVSLDQGLGGDPKGGREGMCRSKGWASVLQSSILRTQREGTSPSWSDGHC